MQLIRILYIVGAIIGSIWPITVFFSTTYRIGETCNLIIKRPIYLLFCVVFCVFLAIFNKTEIVLCLLSLFVLFCAIFLCCCVKQKKKLTKKGGRLLCVYAILIATICYFSIKFSIFYLLFALFYPLLFVSKIILMPLERFLEKRYENKAKQKLNQIKPQIIAITGSYGKTTLKNILAHILSTKYSVCVSPSNYNTPQGITITINNYLKPTDQILICEFGARKKGDIARLCALVEPDYCVLTAISNQHVETFKSQQTLVKEKFSIFYGGEIAGFFNGDDEVVKMLYNSYSGKKAITGKHVWYDQAKIQDGLQKFCICKKEKRINVSCPLLADYIPSTITLAVMIAQTFKISEKRIKFAINTLKPVAHRLELLYNGKDVIIDDSYNSNEKGFISAINLLSTFDGKVKVIITPGVIELGKVQSEVNSKLAQYASDRVDYILCYGVNATAISKGSKGKALVFIDRTSCVNYYKTINGERAVLFENDLPDVY